MGTARAALLACALLACRPRARREAEHAGAVDAGASVADARARDDRSASNDLAMDDASVAPPGGSIDFAEGSRWDPPAGDGAVALGAGEVSVAVPPGSIAPARVDTPAGRLIVTSGGARAVVRWVAGGAEVAVTTDGAVATFWRDEGGAARAARLPRAARRSWAVRGVGPSAMADLELARAEALLAAARRTSADETRAGLAVGRASSLLAAAGEGGGLAARRDALRRRLGVVAR